MAIHFTVNGTPVVSTAPETTPLLWSLRDLSAHRARHRTRGEGGLAMKLTRREFMVCVGGLGFSVLLDGCAGMRTTRGEGASLAASPPEGIKSVNAWASLASDGTVYI